MSRKIPLILIIDDDATMYTILSLAHPQYQFRWVDNGKDGLYAVTEFYRSAVSLVILDFEMPGMNGLVVLEEIRKTMPDLPIIMWSGNHGVKEKALAKGATVFLEKPFEPGNLEMMLQDLLETTSKTQSKEGGL